MFRKRIIIGEKLAFLGLVAEILGSEMYCELL